MSKELWAKVDNYLEGHFLPEDSALTDTLRTSDAEGLDPIAVTPTQGKLLNMLVQMHGSRRVLELGTLGGYSTICMARALPEDGQLVTLELVEHNAAVARRNIDAAGVGGKVDIRVGDALDSLKAMVAADEAPFDFVFMDANKDGYPAYFEEVMKLVKKGSVIIADNVIRNGAVLEADNTEPYIVGIRKFNELVAAEPRVTATALQTVGAKGCVGLIGVEGVDGSGHPCEWAIALRNQEVYQ